MTGERWRDEPREEIPKRSFVVREPWATYIVQGRKTWEIRRYPTRIRGRIGIVSPRDLIGAVQLVRVLGPFTVEELLEEIERHLAPGQFLREYAQERPLWAWELQEAEEFAEPYEVERAGGPRIWVVRRQVRQRAQ
ncbi:MAG: ASCH domain-containing protein [Thermomicrobium sp.]|nr:ASCH domain-containing protein [Thermomicrobium sp.]